MIRGNAPKNTDWKAHRTRLYLGGGLGTVFILLWIADSLSNAINALVATGTLGMAYFSFVLNRQAIATERRRIKPLCYCEPAPDRAHLARYGVAPKAYFYQKKDGKEITDHQDTDAPLLFRAWIVNGGTGPACNVRLCLGSAHLPTADGHMWVWTELIPVAPVIIPSVTPWMFTYEFTSVNVPPSGEQKRLGGESSSIRGFVADLCNNVSAIHLQYEDIEGNIYHSSLSLLTRTGSIHDPDDKKFQGHEPITRFSDGKIPMHPWYTEPLPGLEVAIQLDRNIHGEYEPLS